MAGGGYDVTTSPLAVIGPSPPQRRYRRDSTGHSSRPRLRPACNGFTATEPVGRRRLCLAASSREAKDRPGGLDGRPPEPAVRVDGNGMAARPQKREGRGRIAIGAGAGHVDRADLSRQAGQLALAVAEGPVESARHPTGDDSAPRPDSAVRAQRGGHRLDQLLRGGREDDAEVARIEMMLE